MTMRHLSIAGLLLILSLVSLTGCGGDSASSTPASDPQSVSEPPTEPVKSAQ